jgi:hypothetical protein
VRDVQFSVMNARSNTQRQHVARELWHIANARRVECLTSSREYVLISPTHATRGGLCP